MGKNGAGKSTLLKILAGVRNATRGQVSAPKDTVIAYLPQHLMTEDGRTVFEEASQAFAHLHTQRSLIAKMKMLAVDELIKDKSIVLIDDSIVRGTQLGETTEYLYDRGAKEVHIRPACPPIMFGCKYLNFSRSTSEMDLITRRVIEDLEGGSVSREVLEEYANPESEKYAAMVEAIRKKLGFTSLQYCRLDDMLESTGLERCQLCTYCWDGKE